MVIEIDENEQLQRNEWMFFVKLRAGRKCERCNVTASGRYLQAHHKDGNKKNNALSNGEALCSMCHAEQHREGRSAAMRRAWKTRRANGYTAPRRPMSAKTRKKIAVAAKKRDLSYLQSPASRAKRSESMKRSWAKRKAKAA